MDKLLRELIWARSKGYCEVTGAPLDQDDWAAHHRKLRKHGGPDAPQNLMVLSHKAHNLGTGSVHLSNRRAYQNGWLVRSHEDPAAVPCLLAGNRWVYLLPNGECLDIKEKT